METNETMETSNAGRADFDHTCECGYYECVDCGAVFYPMETETDDQGHRPCPACDGPLVYRKQSIFE